ncbi:aminotransferase class V-fold PLP-dependent enzyme (plasmid) [Aliisedimentitalea scapharcae]|uniref:Aminotransferase class V-fold PLP-dependent enzyme n=1 Tax=Aliisedimentitalea scapharcae TaxID=1524259 RepID=A0ABZ2XYI2_9RHOB
MTTNQNTLCFPETGKRRVEILDEMDAARAGDWDWFSLNNLTASYYGGPEVAEVAKEAFVKHIGDNVVHQTGLHPSVRKYETDVIAMVKDLFNAPENAAATITTGGSESIVLALKTARDRARDQKGIISPNIIVPQSAYAVFNKLSHFLGIGVIQMQESPDYRADVAGMEAAINENNIMLVGSCPPFPLGVVDPIAEIAGLAQKHDLWMHVDACIGGFMLPFARELGEDVPDFDFQVPGVTSMSADFHKYGYGYRGCSILVLRDEALVKWQGFAANNWNAGDYYSKNTAGSRNSGPIASTWAVFNFLGRDGFHRVTADIIKGRKAFCKGIEAIEGLEILGTPQGPHFAFKAEDLNILAVADGLMAKGWAINIGSKPDAILLMLSCHHYQIADTFLADLREVVDAVKQGSLKARGDEEVYGIY